MKFCAEKFTRYCVDYPDHCHECGAYREPTNADHIRSTTDEELAWRMMQLNFCPPNINDGKVCGDNANCHQCWVDWLKQPYKEDA